MIGCCKILWVGMFIMQMVLVVVTIIITITMITTTMMDVVMMKRIQPIRAADVVDELYFSISRAAVIIYYKEILCRALLRINF